MEEWMELNSPPCLMMPLSNSFLYLDTFLLRLSYLPCRESASVEQLDEARSSRDYILLRSIRAGYCADNL
eukprot:scaffold1445_cov177-Skeletonema_marinoi.AAC.1